VPQGPVTFPGTQPLLDKPPLPGTQPLRVPAAPARRARARKHVAKWSSILLAGVIALILAAVAGMALGAWRFLVIDTGSMRPTLNPGDIAIVMPEPIGDLRRGQIVAFHPPGERRLTVTHRVFSLSRTRDAVVIRTKGDANNDVDPWRARIVGRTVWHEVLKLPKLGYLAVWSQHRAVRLALLVVIVFLFVCVSMGWIWRSERP
jgi:signal peptidase